MKEMNGRLEAVVSPAGIWHRLLAYFLDYFVIGSGVFIITYVISLFILLQVENLTPGIEENIQLFAILLGPLYLMLLPIYWSGYTVGKWIAGIRIVRMDGKKLGWETMLLRLLVSGFIYAITLGIALIVSILMVALRKDKRALHDLIAGTYVTYQIPNKVMDSNKRFYNSDKTSENKDKVTDDQTTNTFHNNKTEFETNKSFPLVLVFLAGIVVGVFIVTIGLLYNDHLSLQSSDAVSSEFDSIQGFSYNEEFPNNVSVENNLEEVIPTEIEAIEAINQANYLYSHRYGFVPDHIAEQEEKESLKAIIESFPEEWAVGLMIVRSQSSNGNLWVDYFPVIKTQTGYLFADYYLKGVEINKVSWDTVYGYDQYPISNAEKEPIVIWRSSETWNTYQDLIWEDYFWLYDDYTLLPDFDHVFLN